jgi:cation:H+ antiporter
MLDLALVVLGGVLLYYGAEWLIDGAAGVARRFGIPQLVVGLTVVSYGTSAPELAVSLSAAGQGQSAIVLGNVIGSNIANVGLILGLVALIAPPKVDPLLFRREVPYLLIATLAAGPVLLNGQIDRAEGALFVLSALVFTAVTFHWAKDERRQETVPGAATDETPKSAPRLALLVVVGLAGLLGGGRVFVEGAVGLARDLGVSERIIGLTVVAFGTSVPELAASVVAALRGHSDLAVGNVVGSNLFNILFILGVTALVSPVQGTLSDVRVDLIVMTVLTFCMAMSLHKARTITRAEGVFYVTTYIGFLVGLALLR